MHVKIFLLILVCNFHSLNAQISVHGKLADMEGNNLAYATISLLKIDSTFIEGTITDTLGYYQFENLKSGTYLLAFSCMGYKSKVSNIFITEEHLKIPLFSLESDNITLDELVVTGSSIIRKENSILILPDKKQVKHAATGYDLLYNLMISDISVNRNTGKVTAALGDVTLYIDGVKANYRDIQSLRPRDVEKVEYFDAPTGRYAGDKAAINYITKQYKSGGYLSLDGKQNIGYLMGDYNVNLKQAHGNTSYMFWGGYMMKKYDGIQVDKNESLFFPDHTIYRKSITENSILKNNQKYAQFKVLNRTDKHIISGDFSLIHDVTPKNENLDNLKYSGYYDFNEYSISQVEQQSLKPSLALYGNFTLPQNQMINASVNASYTHNKYQRNYNEGLSHSLTNVEEDLCLFNSIIKYNLDLKHSNSLGIDARHYHSISSSIYNGDYNSWQHLWMGESMLFFNYTQRFLDRLNVVLMPGVSLLNYKLRGENIKQYFSLQMQSQAAYRFNKNQQLLVSFDIGNSHPDISYVNNVDQTVDFLQIKRGNPYLDNTKVYKGALVYTGLFGRLNLTSAILYDVYLNNIFADYYVEDDKLVNSFRSDGDAYKVSIQFGANYRFTDNLRAKFAVKYDEMRTVGAYSIKEKAIATFIDVNYFLKDFSVNLFAKSPMKNFDFYSLSIIKTPPTYGFSIGWSRKGWFAKIGTENPFNQTNRYEKYMDLGVYKYNQIQTSRIYQQTGYLKIAYTFEFGHKISRDNNDMNRNINSAIMKSN